MSALNKYLKVSILALLFLPVLAGAQPLGTWPVRYGTGAPSGIPSGQGTRLYYDITAAGGGQWYEWQPSTGGGCACWKQVGRGIDETDGTGAPTYTPGVGQSNFIVNVENEMFRHTGGGTWVQILAPTTYTAGTGISISGGVISNTIPRLIMQDEGTALPDPIVRLNFIGAGISVSTPFSSQTANVTLDSDLNALANNSTNGILVRTGPSTTGITGRTIVAGEGISIANGTGSGGNPTVTNTGDLSSTNELQILSISGQDLTLSNGGGTVTIPAGADGNGIYGGSGNVLNHARAHIDSIGDFAFGELLEAQTYNLLNWDYERQYGLILDTLRVSAVVASKTDPFTGGIGYQNLFQVNDTSILLRQVKAGQFTYIECIINKGKLKCNEVTKLDTAKVEILISADSFTVIDDRPGGIGLQYNKDLSMNFKDNSLITKKWVNNFGKNIFTANDTIATGGRVGLGSKPGLIALGRINLDPTLPPEINGTDQAYIAVNNRGVFENPGTTPAVDLFSRDSIAMVDSRVFIANGGVSITSSNNSALPLTSTSSFSVGNGSFSFVGQDQISAGPDRNAIAFGNAGGGSANLEAGFYTISTNKVLERYGLYASRGNNGLPNGGSILNYQFPNGDPDQSAFDGFNVFVGYNIPSNIGSVNGAYVDGTTTSYYSPQIEGPMFGVRQQVAAVGAGFTYDWISVNLVEDDTTGNNVSFYNMKYALPNAAPGIGEKILTWTNGSPAFESKGILTNLTSSQISALPSPVTGQTVYCTDCTALDLSTGVAETFNGSVWKKHW